MSDKQAGLQAKLLAFQQAVGAVKKSAENPFYGNKYADINAIIEQIKPILNEVGLTVMQPLTHIDGTPAIKTIITDPETGEMIVETVPLMQASDVQKFGATVTYTRRFALQSMLFLDAEDDDGESAVTRETISREEVVQALTGDWRDTEIHFGKNKGRKLGELSDNSLQWYIDKWTLSTDHTPSNQDRALRAALDKAKEEQKQKDEDFAGFMGEALETDMDS